MTTDDDKQAQNEKRADLRFIGRGLLILAAIFIILNLMASAAAN